MKSFWLFQKTLLFGFREFQLAVFMNTCELELARPDSKYQ